MVEVFVLRVVLEGRDEADAIEVPLGPQSSWLFGAARDHLPVLFDGGRAYIAAITSDVALMPAFPLYPPPRFALAGSEALGG